MYYDELVLRYLTLKNQGTRYVQANIQDYMDDYLESQCKEYNESSVNADRKLFENIMKVLEGLKEQNIFNFEEINIDELGKRIVELKKKEEFIKYVGSVSGCRVCQHFKKN